jgi:hypothetical protein
MFGKHYQEREAYPPSSLWGSDGWSYLKSELAKAEKKFRNLARQSGSVASRH